MALLNYTSTVDADRTAMEIARCLSAHGATAVSTEYQDGVLSGISFEITLQNNKISFRLPCDWRPVYKILEEQKPLPDEYHKKYQQLKTDKELQAVRTAWRIVKDWVEAQMALVETRMVTTQDVFLPYATLPDGKTLAEKVRESPQFLLGK